MIIITETKRSLCKTLSWRVFATILLFIVSYFVTGQVEVASTIVGIEVVIKTVSYYVHERVWSKIGFGLVSANNVGLVSREKAYSDDNHPNLYPPWQH